MKWTSTDADKLSSLDRKITAGNATQDEILDAIDMKLKRLDWLATRKPTT